MEDEKQEEGRNSGSLRVFFIGAAVVVCWIALTLTSAFVG